jgi:hypothetical protein
MRTTFGLICFLVLSFGAVAAFAGVKTLRLQSTIKGRPIGPIKMQGVEPHSMAALKAQNHLSTAMNQKLVKEKSSAGGSFGNPGIKNGTIDTLPYFNSWFNTGTRNSIYTYSMVGHSPKLGGTTGIHNELIPLITVLLDDPVKLNILAVFDPTFANDPQGTDIDLVKQSPLYDGTTTYPGNGGSLPPDSGQVVDTNQRAEFSRVRTADWHTLLNPPTSPSTQYIQLLFLSNGDWAYACCDQNNNNFPVVNINTISNIFGQVLANEMPANHVLPIIVTDYVAAFDPSSGNCCTIGFHTAQPGIVDPAGILVWAWASFLPQSNNPFAPFFSDVSLLSHEITETYNDPFVNTSVAPWVDGSVSFAQGDLETGDVIENMAAGDTLYSVPLNTAGGLYTYNVQNEALLQWFTRNPMAPVSGPGPRVYSWPNTNTLNNGHNPAGPCGTLQGCWVYGEAPAGFFFGPPF